MRVSVCEEGLICCCLGSLTSACREHYSVVAGKRHHSTPMASEDIRQDPIAGLVSIYSLPSNAMHSTRSPDGINKEISREGRVRTLSSSKFQRASACNFQWLRLDKRIELAPCSCYSFDIIVVEGRV